MNLGLEINTIPTSRFMDRHCMALIDRISIEKRLLDRVVIGC